MTDRPDIRWQEWLWVGIASLLVMGFVSVPYLIGVAHSSPEMMFSGHLFNLTDMYSYIAKMREGATGGWTYTLAYTYEPHRASFVYLYYLGLGKVAAIVSGQGAQVSAETLAIAYHAARVVCGLLLLLVVYRFVAVFLDEAPKRRMAWALAALSSGLGWIPTVLHLLGVMSAAPRLPVSYYIPEAFTILLLYGFPHLALVRALMLGGWLLMLRADSDPRGGWGLAAGAGATWTIMGVVLPTMAALLGVLLAAWLIALWVWRRRFPWAAVWRASAAGIGPVAVLIFNAWVFTRDPIYAAWAAGNVLPSPPVVDYLLAYGLLVVLAVPGVAAIWRRGLAAAWLLLLVWPLVGAVLVYAPISIQRRLLEGVIVPLSIFATIGLWQIVGEKPDGEGLHIGWRLRQGAMGGLLMLLVAADFLLVGGGALRAANPEWTTFHPADDRAALDWLLENAPSGSIVLAEGGASSYLPAYASVRTVVGHGPETIDGGRKRAIVDTFFLGGMSDAERLAWLDETGADYVWVGPGEMNPDCEASCFEPDALGLDPVYHQGRVTIYAVPSSPVGGE